MFPRGESSGGARILGPAIRMRRPFLRKWVSRALGLAAALGAGAARGDDSTPAPVPGSAFFQSLGSNGRACASRHHPADGWTITPRGLRARFDASGGLDPIFQRTDAANCPGADVSTAEARRRAYSVLLARGVIRVTLPVPSDAEFTVLAVDDPHGCASPTALSVYRRPLPLTNFDVLGTVVWDGRHTVADRAVEDDLAAQAVEATLPHAQSPRPPTAEQVREIVEFQRGLGRRRREPSAANARTAEAVTRGEGIFKTRILLINGVGGLNDVLEKPFIVGSCATCHDTPAGVRRAAALLNIGVNDPARRTPDLPLFTLRCRATGEVVKTLDLGRALVTGACRDIGKIKAPVLRGLAGRAPYFHNGSAATLMDVVEFYNARFQIRLAPQEKADLVAFLSTL